MPNWDPLQYGAYLDWRTRPSRDLVQRVDLVSPRRVIDLGCGPGNSTVLCKQRWPEAAVVGLDSSVRMIESARKAYPDLEWKDGDIREWASEAGEAVDVIFSSAALQWVDDHADLFPRLMQRLAPGGVLAAQMPSYEAVPNDLMRQMAASERWRRWFPEGRAKEWRSHSLNFYHAVLSKCATWVDLWATDYLHILPNVDGIVEWYKGTGLRPYLECIADAVEREAFLNEYRERLTPFFPESEGGVVPFPFRRIFILAGLSGSAEADPPASDRPISN